MRDRSIAALVTTVALAAVLGAPTPSAGQAPGKYAGPRTPDGKPNLNGIWQALNTANWDLEAHNARPSPHPGMLGAILAAPPGAGVVEGNEIPYQPWALAKKKENAANWLTLDPEVKCYMPGIPRATYMPHPFQIIQTPTTFLFAYQYATSNRVVPIGPRKEEPAVDTWMGESVARWDGDTLVVDGKGFNDQTWFDRAGNFHSEALHVVERYTPIDNHVMNYEVTIEDPKVFTRPWKIVMPLYRHVQPNAQLIEFRCVEFAEEMLYGHLVKPGAPK
jgi:hypothetical protein